MPTFTEEDVRHLARLARLELTPEEVAAFARQLGEILEFAGQIAAVDLRTLDPSTVAPGGMLRDDEVRPSLPAEEALSASAEADSRGGLFKVPRVLNG